MLRSEPLPITHSWPLSEQEARFELGCDFGIDGAAMSVALPPDRLDALGIGRWECDLIDNRLIWSPAVRTLFGLPHDARLSRTETVGLYDEGARVAMERLRAHAIKHSRGFTLDARIRTVGGERRWMRLMAAPICEHGRVVRLHGLKQDVSHLYR